MSTQTDLHNSTASVLNAPVVVKDKKVKKEKKEGSKDEVSAPKAEVSVPKVETAPSTEGVKKVKAPKVPKEVKQEAVVVEAPKEVVVASEEAVSTSTESAKKEVQKMTRSEVDSKFDEVIASCSDKLAGLKLAGGGNSTESKFLRAHIKSLKELKKNTGKMQSKKGKREPSTSTSSQNGGFKKPVKISKELQSFLGVSEESVARGDVTKHICNYIRDHNLQNPENRKLIIPDAKLSKLIGHNNMTSYFIIQREIQPHFIKEQKA